MKKNNKNLILTNKDEERVSSENIKYIKKLELQRLVLTKLLNSKLEKEKLSNETEPLGPVISNDKGLELKSKIN